MKSRRPTEQMVQRWIDGDGQGEGINYRPFFVVRDVPSEGRSTIVLGLKVPRRHHYLSDIEYGYHVLGEFKDPISEIREQFALLPREETLEIAHRLGVLHPVYPGTSVPCVLTSDLVYTVAGVQGAYLVVLSCKPKTKLKPAECPDAIRTLEKLLIEAEYWKRRKIQWHLVTDETLPRNLFKNLDMFRPTMFARELDQFSPLAPKFASIFRKNWLPYHTLNEMLNITATALCQNLDIAFNLLGKSIWTKQLQFDLNASLIDHDDKLPLLLPLER